MKLINDVFHKILFYYYKYNYNKVDLIKQTNKLFYNILLNIHKKFNIQEELYICSIIVHYRPELNQIEYLNHNFIFFNDIKFIEKWYSNKLKINYHSYDGNFYKIITPLFTHTYNKNYEYYNIDYRFDYTKLKYNYDDYFIYYLYEDFHYCYHINYLILPYFDENITKKKNYLHYNHFKINKFSNHNITKINSISF